PKCRTATPGGACALAGVRPRPPIYPRCAPDAAARALQILPRVRLRRLPRTADFALWATACESAFRPSGTFEAAYSNNRRDAIEHIIAADPVAPHLRQLMADRAQWTGRASDPSAGRHQPVWVAKERPRTRWPTAPGTDLPPHTRDRDCLRPRGAVRNAHNQDNGYRREPIA